MLLTFECSLELFLICMPLILRMKGFLSRSNLRSKAGSVAVDRPFEQRNDWPFEQRKVFWSGNAMEEAGIVSSYLKISISRMLGDTYIYA